ncbi:MAG: DUF2461 domain-containing protein [Paludibacteraceae bacterium]|nr:DUF2461 domain-containing protein [Paludibacteraceae bacterium]
MTQAREILDFLKDLAANNDREWFAENKARYTSAMDALKEMVDRLIGELQTFDGDLAYLQAKDCVYRIYRDIRFSPDKSPYKRHMAAYMSCGGRKSIRTGYYLHLQPNGESLLAGGLYCVDSKMVKAARKAISDNAEEFLEIVNDASFSDTFEVMGEKLKRMPLGFDADSPVAEFVKHKDFSICKRLPDDFFDRAEWESEAVELFRRMKRYNDFMNSALDDYYNV